MKRFLLILTFAACLTQVGHAQNKKEQIAILQSTVEARDRQIDSLRTQLTTAQRTIEMREARVKTLEKEVADLKNQTSRLGAKMASLTAERDGLRQELDSTVRATSEQISALTSQLTELFEAGSEPDLNQLAEQNEGYKRYFDISITTHPQYAKAKLYQSTENYEAGKIVLYGKDGSVQAVGFGTYGLHTKFEEFWFEELGVSVTHIFSGSVAVSAANGNSTTAGFSQNDRDYKAKITKNYN